MGRAALEVSGQIGFAQMTVEQLLERSASHRDRFYRAFGDKAACYTGGYEFASEELADRLLAAGGRGADWPAGMRTALLELKELVAAEPALLKGILAEVYAAGAAALVKRKEVFERLSRAIDRARRETEPSRHSPPPITPDFILSGIEAVILKSFHRRGADFAETIPSLVYMSVALYFGPTRARAEFRRSRT